MINGKKPRGFASLLKTDMARLRDFPWWLSTWVSKTGSSPATAEMSKHGVLKNVRLLRDGITLIMDHNGVIYTSKITPHLSEDFLILLRHILLQQWEQPMEVVENSDIGFDHLTKKIL